MPPQNDSTALMLGEIRGQLREAIHNMNNQSQKIDAIGDKLAKLEGIPDQLDKLETRLTALEADRYRRDGAMGFGGWILKSPLVAWIVAGVVMTVAYFKGTPQ